MPGKSKFQISRSLDERIKRIINGAAELDSEFKDVNTAYILGFNYGNITNCVGLTTNYQLHHAVFPVVGIVFFKTSPNDEDIKSSLKSVKEYSSSPNGLGSFKSDKNEHLFLVYSIVEDLNEVERRIFNFTKGSFVRRRRLRLSVLDDPYNPRQIRGGNEDFFNIGDGDSLGSSDEDQVDHLIFFIHGVGGVCDVRFRSCIEVVADFKKMANNLLAQQSNPSSRASTPSNKQFSQHLKSTIFRKNSNDSTTSSHVSDTTNASKSNSSGPTRRVECLPISWHSCTRRQTGMNDQLGLISLSSVPKLRHFLNKVVMDAMLYASGPVYSQVIINNVGDEINRLYTLFMEKHPNFTGSISLAGHSLGSVIVFDLLAHQVASEIESNHQDSDNINNNSVDIINNNNESNPEIRQTTPVSAGRQNCGNISHHHYNMTSSANLNHCSDYKNLEELLKDLNLMKYAEMFQKEHIDIKTLLLLTDLDMKELNLTLGARRKLGSYINFKKVSLLDPSNDKKNTQYGQQQSVDESETKSTGCQATPFDGMNTGQFSLKYPQLKFKPRCFFSFGSPTAMFLNVRGLQNISKEYRLPTCDRMLNIFHPYDPLAYRMEPLIDPRFKSIEPIQIPHHRGGKRMHVQLREGFARVGHDIKHRLLGSLKNTWSSFTKFSTNSTTEADNISNDKDAQTESARRKLTTSSSADVEIESFDSSQSDSSWQKKPFKRQQHIARSQSELNASVLDSIIEGSARQNLSDNDDNELNSDPTSISADNLDSFPTENSDSNGKRKHESNDKSNSKKDSEPVIIHRDSSDEFDSTKIGSLNGGKRIDYVLQEKPIELFNEYIFAFTSHANYWQNEDSALIILNEIYHADNVQIFDQSE